MARIALLVLGLGIVMLSACAVDASRLRTQALWRRVLRSEWTHRHDRSLRWTGDLLGQFDKDADELQADEAARAAAAAARPLMTKAKVKELQDHAHFYGAAEALTRWTESVFALSALAHAALAKQPDGAAGSACVHDGKRCLMNPAVVSGAGFPAPQLPAEKIIQRFAKEAFVCRGSADRATCHLDSNCDWDDRTGACFLAHDPHSDFTNVIAMCQGTIYTPAAKACWRRRPDSSAWRPCGETGCTLFAKGSEVGPGTTTAADRCLPAAPGNMQQKDLYNMLKRLYGETYGMDELPVATIVTLANGTQVVTMAPAAGAAGFGAAALQEGHEFAKEGFGSCDTAALHHGFATSCRHAEEQEACEKDNRCRWLEDGVRGSHCVLTRHTVVQLLLGGSAFTQAALQAEAACTAAAGSRDACLAVKHVQQQQQQQSGGSS